MSTESINTTCCMIVIGRLPLQSFMPWILMHWQEVIWASLRWPLCTGCLYGLVAT